MLSTGKRFENNFKNSVPKDVFFYRFRDGSSAWGGNDKVRFQAQNIADCILFDANRLFVLELKSVKGKSLPLSNIREHQIKDLTQVSQFKNIVSGFVIEFNDLNECYFIDINTFREFLEESERKSLPLDFCVSKGLKIGVEKKRTNSVFDIATFLKEIK